MKRRGLVLLVLVGMVFLRGDGWAVKRASVRIAPTPVSTPVPAVQALGGVTEVGYPNITVPGPPPPGTVLIRLEIPKIGFVSSVFPVGLEGREGQVVMGEPAMDTVWTLDLSDPLVQAYGWGGRNYTVWAHRADWGSRWPELRIGDKIRFFTVSHSEEKGFYGVYYEATVFSWAIIPVVAEYDFYQASEEPMLTLVTCHPEDDPDPQERLVIRARFPDKLR